MTAEIITIGDELLIGQVLDTNSCWIAKQLNDNGLRVVKRTSVGDSSKEILRAFDKAMWSADVTIVTGGLGPTGDDLTKSVLAEFFNCGMTTHSPTEKRNKEWFAARGYDYNEANRAQSSVPECCEVLMNPNGTAPGMWFEEEEHILVALPGVPFEMKHMMENEVLPKLRKQLGPNEITHQTMLTFGIGESMLAEKIAAWEQALPEWLSLAYLPSPKGVRLRLSAYENTSAAAEIDKRFKELEVILSDSVVGYGEDASIEKVIAAILTERGQTLAIAESCTGGALATMFTSMEGASKYFRGGVVAYNDEVKKELLGVSEHELERESAVSQSVVEQMAGGIRERLGVDFAIATTGIAGPSGGSEEKPVGTVWIAVAHPKGIESQCFRFGNLRSVNIDRACSNAANMLRLIL